MKRSAIVISLFLALVASACGFGAGTAYFNVTQPAVPGSNAQVYFEVKDGETSSDLGPRLQDAGLIRNGAIFTFYTKYIKKFDLKSGVYTLPPGMRVLEYTGSVTPKKKGCTEYADDDPQKPAPAPRFHDLPRFNAENFMKIVTTGKYNDGSNVSDSYWFVPKELHKDAKFALE